MKLIFTCLIIPSLFLLACNKDDCRKKNEVLKRYAVEDSVLIPISQEWLKQTYILEVVTCEKNPDWMRISNLSDENFEVTGQQSGDAFTIDGQSAQDGSWNDVNCTGTIENASIEFEYSMTSELGEPFIGRGSGSQE